MINVENGKNACGTCGGPEDRQIVCDGRVYEEAELTALQGGQLTPS